MEFNHNMSCVDCECEDQRPTLTRQRLNAINFPTLLSISGRTVIANLERIPPEFITDKIPCALQHFLLKKMEKLNSKFTKWDVDMFMKFEDEARCRKTLAFLDVLVGPACTEFCVDWLLVLCPEKETGDKADFLCKVLCVLANKAPNLRKLIIGNVEQDGEVQLFGEDQLDWMNPSDGFGKPLLALGKSLRSLTLNLNLRSDELVLIGRHLPNLEFLKIASIICHNMNELQQATVEIMSNLNSLDHFVYNKVMEMDSADPLPPDSDEHYNLFCLMNFPRLQTISRGGFLPLYNWGHLDLPADCKLTQITIDADEEWFTSLDSNPFLMLPHIIELRVRLHQFYGSFDEAASLSQLEKLMTFPRLRGLSIGIVPPPEIMCLFLNSYGRNLVKMKLHIYGRSNVHVLHQLSQLCPILKELHLRVTSLPVEKSLMPASPGSLPSLTTLHLLTFESQEFSVECILLAAPNLQKLRFENVVMTQAESQRLSSLVRSQRICTHLTSFTVISSWSQDEYTDGKVKAMSDFAKDMCAFSPRLVNVTYRFDDYQHQSFNNYPDLADALKKFKDCCLQKCLNTMDDYQFM